MKASKIITLGLVAASAGLIMGTVALPAQAASLDRVVNVQLTNRPDSGKDGNYRALNHCSSDQDHRDRPWRIQSDRPRQRLVQRWLSLLGRPWPWTPLRNCTPGYSPCLPPASDYDCRGGSGNGPKYTDPSASPVPTPTT